MVRQDHKQSRMALSAPSGYHVRILERDDWAAWDTLVRESPQGTLFHTTKWLDIIGTPFRIYGCYHEDRLVGGMAVEIVGPNEAGHSNFTTSTAQPGANGQNGDILGHEANCPYLGVVLSPPQKKYLTTLAQHRRILNSIALRVKEEFASVNSRMVPEMIDMQPFMWAGYSISLRYTFRIDLSDLATAWSNMTDKRRNDIRKAERDGIVIDQEGSIDDLLALVSKTFERQGRLVRFSQFAQRRDQMLHDSNQRRCFIARDRSGELVAGNYVAWDDKCAYYLMGGYGINDAHRGAGALAIWEAIRFAGGLGVRQFDILASSVPAIERFIRDFGGRLTVAYIVDYARPSRSKDVRRIMSQIKRLVTGRQVYQQEYHGL